MQVRKKDAGYSFQGAEKKRKRLAFSDTCPLTTAPFIEGTLGSDQDKLRVYKEITFKKGVYLSLNTAF